MIGFFKNIIGSTLGRYMATNFVINFIFLLSALLAVVYLFDVVELIRRASKRDDIPLGLVFQMGLLKLPEVGQLLFPFAVLFSAIYTFWKLTKSSELIVMRSAGLSVWQFLAPVIFATVLIAILQISVINPVGALLVSKFEDLESRYLKNQTSEIAFFKQGFWLRQNLEGAEAEKTGYIILHAEKVTQPGWHLKNAIVFQFNAEDILLQRIDARSGSLDEGRWVFDLRNTDEDAPQLAYLETNLTGQDIEDSFASPEAMSFWKLPGHIETLQATGFDATKIKVHYQTLLAQPLMFSAMILLAACVSMRLSRAGGGFYFIASGVALGFLIFFLSSFLQALGASGQIPPTLAAWSPALISFALGLATLMTLEDG